MCHQNNCEGHVVKCSSCKGTGRDHLTPLIKKCDVCKGVGSVLLK
ncbi:hypothetical protein [Nonomuraea roseoviolacea]|uniref:DnaJ-class molecular chaperone n=1 Tax=Nonomuraea roseoviolacea subsp. carminata TaxID=160689 RepID=A0ABT1JYV7_9ACTN|nr:hypothetical protein [Nonomuraea roseoviolacea]MCP2346934.1 DnaJ-class molecular chaperone [Nonomuraea roseoviolacea subsp. carminata]